MSGPLILHVQFISFLKILRFHFPNYCSCRIVFFHPLGHYLDIVLGMVEIRDNLD